MTPDQFAYWLQGYVEMTDGEPPSIQQWQMIKNHLKLAFRKETPDLNLNRRYPAWDPYWDPMVPAQLKPMCSVHTSGWAPGRGGGGAC